MKKFVAGDQTHMEADSAGDDLKVRITDAFDESPIHVEVLIGYINRANEPGENRAAQVSIDAGTVTIGNKFRCVCVADFVKKEGYQIWLRITNSHGAPLNVVEVTGLFSE